MGAVVILLTVNAVTFSRGLLLFVVILAVPSILQHLFFPLHTAGAFPFVNRLLSLGFDLLIIALISRHVFQIENPDSETIFGALCIYLLVGFAFASLYATIANRDPHAFSLNLSSVPHLAPDRFDFIYFSFGTLTELGTSGMIAVAPLARSVSLLEAIIGILYMAVLLARLITAYRSVEASEQRDVRPYTD